MNGSEPNSKTYLFFLIFGRLSLTLQKLKSKPFHIVLLKGFMRLLQYTIGILALPFATLCHFLGYRVAVVFAERIGHLAIEPDCLIREIRNGSLSLNQKKIFLLLPYNRCANRHLAGYWDEIFRVVCSTPLCWLFQAVSICKVMRVDTRRYTDITKSAESYRIYGAWGSNPSVLQLTERDEAIWIQKKEELGIPPDAWIVTLHCRTRGFSLVDDDIQDHRNASIHNYSLAIDEIVKRGGWVVRVGDSNMPPLSLKPRIIDYAHSPLKSDELDVILIAKSRFFLGTSSGLGCVATVFGVPCAVANLSPLSVLWFTKKDICLHKKIVDTDGKLIPICEIFKLKISNLFRLEDFNSFNVQVIENDKFEIHDLTKDMLEVLEKPLSLSLARQCSTAFKSFFAPGSHSYYSEAGLSWSNYSKSQVYKCLAKHEIEEDHRHSL